MMKPVLKWAGGKRTILNLIEQRVDMVLNENSDQIFYDVFSGGGSVTIRMLDKCHKLIMNDKNKEVINVYKQINKNYKGLAKLLDEHKSNHDENYYYEIRLLDRSDEFKNISGLEKAARTIYLNKTGFNGLYRVNSKGQFNVPVGRPMYGRKIYDYDNFKQLSEKLKKVKFLNKDFKEVTKHVRPYDIVYLDPPYDVETENSFVSYTKNGFNKEDQIDVYNLFEELTSKGVYVILSNSRTEFIKNLYNKYLDADSKIEVRRSISANKESRVLAKEILIDNFEVIRNEYNNKT